MFKTIEQQGGSGGPQWLSDHPNPGDRYNYILKEAQSLRVENASRDSRGFETVKARLARHVACADDRRSDEERREPGPFQRLAGGNETVVTGTVARPSTSFKTYTEGGVFRISVPSNWREVPGNNSVTFAPDGGYGTLNQQSMFTHGVEAGLARNETHDLQTATDELIQSLASPIRGSAGRRGTSP